MVRLSIILQISHLKIYHPNNTSPANNLNISAFTFTALIKLDNNNFLLWKSQVLASIRANDLESFVNRGKQCLTRTNILVDEQQTITIENPEYLI